MSSATRETPLPNSLDANLIAIAIGIAAAAVVGAAWLFQFAGYLPCQLCLWQRVPYYIAAPVLLIIGLVGLVRGDGYKLTRFALGFAFLVFTASIVLAIYHSGVEWGFWPGPVSCGGANFSATDAGNLLGAISNTRPPSCDEAAGRFLGLSFAGWNVVASVMLAGGCFWSMRSKQHRII